jgi:hypothetical protein
MNLPQLMMVTSGRFCAESRCLEGVRNAILTLDRHSGRFFKPGLPLPGLEAAGFSSRLSTANREASSSTKPALASHQVEVCLMQLRLGHPGQRNRVVSIQGDDRIAVHVVLGRIQHSLRVCEH